MENYSCTEREQGTVSTSPSRNPKGSESSVLRCTGHSPKNPPTPTPHNTGPRRLVVQGRTVTRHLSHWPRWFQIIRALLFSSPNNEGLRLDHIRSEGVNPAAAAPLCRHPSNGSPREMTGRKEGWIDGWRRGGYSGGGGGSPPQPPPPPLWDTDACARPVPSGTKQKCRAKVKSQAPCVTFRLVIAPLRGPGRSPVLPFACCVGSLLSVGRCGQCSCWCRFRVRGAQ